MSDSRRKLQKNLLRQLECPVCFETCMPPIYMCSNGHSVCANCQSQLNKCCTCRAPGKPTLRCFQLEKIAELLTIPCKNQLHGCRQTGSKSDMAKHLLNCKYRYECQICKEWTGLVNGLICHINTWHVAHIIDLPSSGTEAINACDIWDNNTHMLIFFNGALFWLNLRNIAPSQVFSCTLRLDGKNPLVKNNMYFSVEFPSRTSKLKVTYQGNVLNMKEVADKDNTDFVIPAGILDSYHGAPVECTLSIYMPNPPSWWHKMIADCPLSNYMPTLPALWHKIIAYCRQSIYMPTLPAWWHKIIWLAVAVIFVVLSYDTTKPISEANGTTYYTKRKVHNGINQPFWFLMIYLVAIALAVQFEKFKWVLSLVVFGPIAYSLLQFQETKIPETKVEEGCKDRKRPLSCLEIYIAAIALAAQTSKWVLSLVLLAPIVYYSLLQFEETKVVEEWFKKFMGVHYARS